MKASTKRYVVVEGVIGVGKTTLASEVAKALSAREVLEEFEENPFLADFYRDRQAHALSTQLFFLMSRFRQQEELAQPELFRPVSVADYLFEKDRIFAEVNLGPDELRIYEQLFEVLKPRVPVPDLVIYLRAEPSVLLDRIRKRGRSYESAIERDYIEALTEAYAAFFRSYREAPVLAVDAGRFDLRAPGPAFKVLVDAIRAEDGQMDAERLNGLIEPHLL